MLAPRSCRAVPRGSPAGRRAAARAAPAHARCPAHLRAPARSPADDAPPASQHAATGQPGAQPGGQGQHSIHRNRHLESTFATFTTVHTAVNLPCRVVLGALPTRTGASRARQGRARARARGRANSLAPRPVSLRRAAFRGRLLESIHTQGRPPQRGRAAAAFGFRRQRSARRAKGRAGDAPCTAGGCRRQAAARETRARRERTSLDAPRPALGSSSPGGAQAASPSVRRPNESPSLWPTCAGRSAHD